jgi:hypothetical protein
MDEGVLRFIAKAYLLLLSGPADRSGVSPDKEAPSEENGHPIESATLAEDQRHAASSGLLKGAYFERGP